MWQFMTTRSPTNLRVPNAGIELGENGSFSRGRKGSRVSQIKGAPTEADAPYCSNPLTVACQGTGGSWFFQRAWQALCCEVCSEHAALI